MSAPRFAIVGHPNKGKSSLVSTLAQDDTVPVAPESGTTKRAVTYPMRVDGEVLYELVDTPGFQRARRALAWLRESAANASDRAASVGRFIEQHANDKKFSAEVELLRPIVDGAGIIYVVDGAVPYGPDYEAEMEILRWTGQPSLAVINPIGARTHVEAWNDALSQFFRLVREVDVLSAPLERRLDLLRAFGELNESWREPLAKSVEVLRLERDRTTRRAARVVAELLADALLAAPSKNVSDDDDVEAAKTELRETYKHQLRSLEQRSRERVEQIYDHRALAREESDLKVIDEDLFDERTWELFGLSRTALTGVGATGGAAAGIGVDAALGGLSFFLGTAIGALTGGAAAWYAAGELANFEIESLPFGEQIISVRAGSNKNLPFVLLGRARAHHALVSRRSHASRDRLVIHDDTDEQWPVELRKSLAQLFQSISEAASENQLENLTQGVLEAFDLTARH